jgi:Mor family transcriptional regulator
VTALREITSMMLLKHGRMVYLPKGTVLKEMAAKIE